MFDYIGFNVSDFQRSRDFYTAAPAQLGIAIVMQGDGWVMLGKQGKGGFWFGSFGPKASPIHIALAADNRAQVRAFHEAALRAGATDNGPPGLRPQYHPDYYAAFVLDPDGHNLEAVCHLSDA